jgi:hypothetical protein
LRQSDRFGDNPRLVLEKRGSTRILNSLGGPGIAFDVEGVASAWMMR